MNTTRREFVVLTGVAALCGCAQQGIESGESTPPLAGGSIDVGPLTDFPTKGHYGPFLGRKGFYLILLNGRLMAESAVCTHRNCALTPASDGFACRCHGSTFTLDGRVTKAPATRSLPRYAIMMDARQHVIVDPSRRFEQSAWTDPASFIEVGIS